MFAAPMAQNSLDENGAPVEPDGKRLISQTENCFKQLEWMAEALKKQRDTVGIPK